jgi:hypothetical protein
MLKPKQVKYRVVGAFGLLEEGTVINALLLVSDDNRGLLYHPRVKGECPSFEIGFKKDGDSMWVSSDTEQYINVGTSPLAFERALLGRGFKWKRVVYFDPSATR